MWFGSAYLCFFVYPEFKELYYLPTSHPEVHSAMKNASLTGTAYVPENPVHRLHRRSILYMFLLSAAASVSVFCLMIWHVTLISCGGTNHTFIILPVLPILPVSLTTVTNVLLAETSIEAHINKKETKRLAALGVKYRNPYDFGFWENWRNSLGVSRKNFRWQHLLWFSAHRPEGNGIQWETFAHESC